MAEGVRDPTVEGKFYKSDGPTGRLADRQSSGLDVSAFCRARQLNAALLLKL
jgi:hypothetical protein